MGGGGGGARAGAMWARRELRRQWRSLVWLGLLAGLTAALALTAFTGARRSSTVFERLRSATLAPDAVIFASQVGIYDPDWSAVADLPYVAAAGSFGLSFSPFVDRPDHVSADVELGLFSVASGSWRTELDRPVITAGRRPDPTNPREMLAPPEAADLGIRVGDRFVVQLPSERQIAEFDLFSPPEGERVTLTVVGFGRSTFETAVIPGGEDSGSGFIATPAFHDRFAAPATFMDNLLVRFVPGEGSITRLERDARRILGSASLPVLDATAVSKRVTNGTGLEATGLAMFGLAVALAGSVLIGQALVRAVASSAPEVANLRDLGLTRREAALAAGLPHAASIGIAVVIGFVGTVLASPRIPIGLSRGLDPLHGVQLDMVVLVGGLGLMTVVLATAVAATSLRAASPRGRSVVHRRSRVVQRIAAAGGSPKVLVGTSLALDGGRGRRALPTRPALLGAVVGVLGVVGAFTLVAGMEDAIDDPSRFGTTWDVEAVTNDWSGIDTFGSVMDDLDADPAVTASAALGRSLVVYDGVTQPTYALVPRAGHLSFTVLEGRAPAGTGEIALGPETAQALGVEVGGRVQATDHRGDPVSLRVVGLSLLPTTPHSSYDQGAWLSPSQQEAIAGAAIGEYVEGADPADQAGPPIPPGYLARLEPGVTGPDFVERFGGGLDPTLHALTVPGEPIDITNLRRVTSLPVWFAAFTTLMGLGAVAHVCASVARRRAADLAVLRALGMTPHETRSAVRWQARTVALAGVLAGLPFGVVAGRLLWRLIAQTTPLVFVPPSAPVALALTLPAALVAAAAVAWIPARRAGRLNPAEVLRHE